MTENNSSEFSKLKPFCVNVMKDCTIENICKLENVVKVLDSDSVESLQEYIALPFIVHLGKEKSEKITIKCIDFLSFLFKRIHVKEFNFFKDIFFLMFSKICNFQDMNKVISASEELKLSICENMLCLIQCSTEEVMNEVYGMPFRLYLANAIFVFTVMLRDEKFKALIKAVLRTVGAFTYSKDFIKKRCMHTESLASEALSAYLPGLSVALQRAICADDKQAHSVIIMALTILSDLIVLIVGDETYKKNSHDDSVLHTSNEQTIDIPFVIKNEDWLKSVSGNLEILIKRISVITAHNHWKVRLEFLRCSQLLLFNCANTLGNCMPVLLSSVFELSVDDNEVVSSYAKGILTSLSEKLQRYTTLNSVIEENIENLASQLIKINFSSNDVNTLRTLKSLLGYIDVSGSSLNKLVFSMTHLERIVMALLNLLEFNVLELNLVEEIPDFQKDVIHLLWPKKKFKYFEDEEIGNIVCRICYSLVHIGNSRLLIDYLLEKISSNNHFTLQCIFVIGNIIKGCVAEQDAPQKYSALISEVLEAFLSSSMFNVSIHYKDNLDAQEQNHEASTEVPLSNNYLNKNKLQICLLLEAIANCSECLRTTFELHLKDVLCPVMEKAGSSNFIVSHCGQICLYYIAQSCNYKSVQELIKGNADYITNVIMINFSQYIYRPEIAIVLRVVMEQCDAEALVLFRDLIFQVLDLVDYNQGDEVYPLLDVLYSVVVSIKKWFPWKKFSMKMEMNYVSTKRLKTLVSEYVSLKESTDPGQENFMQDSIHEQCPEEKASTDFALGDYCEGEDNSKSGTNKESVQNPSCSNYSVNETKPDVPLHISVVCEIFKRCIHLQSSLNRFVRMLSLETVELCILVLRDSNHQLHPLVHEFWSPFLSRFTEDAFIPKAFNVLLIIANECGDFVRSRTLKDVMSKLVLFLQKEYSKSLMCNLKHYQWTSDHSLQVLVLSEIGNLCSKLCISEKDVNSVVAACLPYLEKKQPKILQDAAAKSLSALATVDADAVWFYWNTLYFEGDVLASPHEDLLKLSFPYSDNSLTSVTIDF